MYFLGVDGGGTKTQIVITDENANILGKSVVGSTYIRSISKEVICETLKEGIKKALEDAGLDNVKFAKSCFGIAGLDNPKDFEVFLMCVRSLPDTDFGDQPLILNDAVCALRRGTDKSFGMAIVAGTGSNCYTKNKEGKEVFVGGLGHILSDEGAGYYVGTRVLHAASKSYDGRIERTMLENMVYEHFGLTNMRDVILKVHEPTFGKKEIASLAMVCEKASDMGDAVAQQIFKDSADELYLMVITAARKNDMLNYPFDLVCSGSSFKNPKGILRCVFECLVKDGLPNANIIYPTNEPAMGCVLMAIDSYKAK